MLEFEINLDPSPSVQESPGLLKRGVPLDGSRPITSYSVFEREPKKKGNYEVFRMDRPRYLRRNLERRVAQTPELDLMRYQYMLPTGMTYIDYVEDRESGNIVDYFVEMYPFLDENGGETIAKMVNYWHKRTKISLPDAVATLLPSCTIEPVEGLSFSVSGKFVFGFGPLGEQQGKSYNRQIEVGLAKPPNLSVPPYSAEVAIAEVGAVYASFGLPHTTEALLYGGIQFRTRDIADIEQGVRTVLTGNREDLTPLTDLVEPYLRFQV